MSFKAIQTTIWLCIFFVAAWGQSYEKVAKKADKYYQLGQYAVAIPLYQTALNQKNSSSWRYKLANCYRLTNKTAEAQTAYQELFEKSRKVRDKAYLHYSEVLMSNGEYDLAKNQLKTYLELQPDDEDARQTLKNIEAIKDIKSYYAQVELLPFNHNSNADDHGAVFLDDGIVFVSDRKRGASLFKEHNGTTGRDFLSLYFAPRSGRMEYSNPEMLPKKINQLNKNTGPASFTEDGKVMVFSQNDHIENRKGEIALQLYCAKRENGKWKEVKKLNFCNPNINYMHPAISPDGKMLFFVSNRSKGEGGLDLYMSTRLANGEWSRPENMGPSINTSGHEGFPSFSHDGRLFFCSKGHIGYGGFDIFFSEMDEYGNWSTPTNLGQPINSSQDDISFCLHQNGKYGLFTSSRDGGDDDIFMFRFKEDDMILSVRVLDVAGVNGISDTSIQAIPVKRKDETKEWDLSSDRFEMSLDNNSTYEIIISKDGYIPYTATITPSEQENNFLQLEATLIKKI